ncbi:MAG: M12 family metallo-peptidase [Planctomycetota bacterium]
MENRTPSPFVATHRARGPLAGLAVVGVGMLAMMTASSPGDMRPSSSNETLKPAISDQDLTEVSKQIVRRKLGITDVEIVELGMQGDIGGRMTIDVPLNGVVHSLQVAPHSVRSPNYEVRVQAEDGSWSIAPPSPVETFRGTIIGIPGSTVTGSMIDNEVHAQIRMNPTQMMWVEPISLHVPNSTGKYAVYRGEDVLPVPGGCGTSHAAAVDALIDNLIVQDAGVAGGGGIGGGGGAPCIAELACDADTEYFNTYGTVAATEAQINSIINTVNQQYESQVGITHQVTTILVRTGSDPYTSTDAETRLCQFITEWTNNQGGVQRDVAHLFTGVNLAGSTIGIASDIGQTGICQNNGSCFGGQFGTQGSYCLSQSDFDSSFACKTDLTAHELGHLWGAFHCGCPSNTMNSGITCANNFSGQSINSITNYAATRSCLTGSCGGGNPVDNDNCADAIPFNGGAGDGVIAYSTIGATTDGPNNPAGVCNDSGSNETANDIWYTYSATCSGTLTVSTCDDVHGQGAPNYDTDLVIYGPYANVGAINCNNLAFNACNDDDTTNPCGGAPEYSSTIEINVAAGEVYLIRVGGWQTGNAGDGFLSVDCAGSGPSGACCFADGSCSITAGSGACTAQGGTYQGDGSSCAPNPCPQPSVCGPGAGDCFSANGTVGCDDVACCELICAADAFCCATEWDQICADAAIANCTTTPTGACCFADGSCNEQTQADCSNAGGTYQGDGSDCSPNPCPQPATGACCFGNGTCNIDTAVGCAAAGGTYDGDNTNCSPNPCPQPVGACCLPDGSCIVVNANDCAAQSGLFQGIFVSCGSVNCPQPEGACCFPDGSCTVLTVGNCDVLNGVYQGDNTSCSPNPCPQPTGACCFASGVCTIETGSDCSNQGGAYQGDGSSCTPNPCPQPMGACCLADGSCNVNTSAGCTAAGGVYQGNDTVCNPNPCPQPMGACCFPDGSCTVLTVGNCTVLGGVYEGDSTVCSPNPCPQPTGSCCVGAQCFVLTESECDAFSGSYNGDGSACSPDPCFVPVTCPWDCAPDNGDGTFGNGAVNIDDLLEVINSFDAPGGPCDSEPDNGDGTFGNGIVNIDDLLGTINNFGACP